VTGTDEANGAGLFGTLNIGGNSTSTATLVVNSPSGPGGGSFVIADATFGTAGHTTASGILNINNNGIAKIYCAITKAAVANNTGNINVNSGGTLDMEAPSDTVGTTAVPLDNVGLAGGSLHLNVDGTFSGTNIVATTVTMSSSTTITIDLITNYPGSGTLTFPLISYTGTDPYAGLSITPTLPAGGFAGTLVDDTTKKTIDLQVTAGPNTLAPFAGPLTWNGGGGNINWSTSGNWNGTNIFAGDTLYFDGTTRLNNNNDTSAGTIYSNLTFNATAGAFILTGNPITMAAGTGNVTNNSSNPQTVELGLSYSGNISLTGGAGGAPLIIGGGLTNTSISTSVGTITLAGTGIITNLFANAASDTNSLAMNSAANWTIVDNPSSTAINATNLGLNILGGGTLNFGNAGSAPVLVTSAEGQNSDSALGDTGTAATLNMVNGALTLGRRLNTQNGNINVSGGTLNIWNQIQMANSAVGNVSGLDVTGGTLDIMNATGTSVGGGPLYVASRGTGTFTISGANTLVECSTVDISRNAVSGSAGTVYLNGGTLKIGSKVGTATANSVVISSPVPSAAFYFNGGMLQANIGSGTVTFQGSTAVNTSIPIMTYVQAGGAIINTPANKNVWIGEMLMHDPALGSSPDGGLIKLGIGILTLASNATYTGSTTISAGTLQLTNSVTVATPNIIIGSNATFDVSAMLSTFTLGSGQTLTGNGTNGVIVGSLSLGTGALALNYTNGIPTLKVTTNGALQAISSAAFTLNNNAVALSVSGSALGTGSYLLIATNTGGSVAGSVATSSLTVAGAGVTGPASLQIIGNGLYLVVGATTTALTSSENPSGFLDNLNFTAAVQTNAVTAGNATGLVNFQTNGVTFSTSSVSGGSATSASLNTLPRGINVITAIYSGDANYLPSTNTLNQTVTNHPPVAGLMTVNLYAGINNLKIALPDLATNWSDADGDTVALVSVSNSTNGATVVTNGGYIFYSNANNVNDQFSYVITDSFGATASGLVNIVVSSTGVFGQTSPSITTSGGALTVGFAGIPGYSYSVQRSTNLTDWVTIVTTNAPAGGVFSYPDSFADLGFVPASAYYRLQWNP
jgi:autotransporter-associated beta strand protein